ncbi:uncharacterized protein LOC106053486 [Biomphalaria glabrata]|uniref:glucan endo-1,3-beta-D-glucosidase n=1 Tax=Biomphalaria glabrata TaxID=6526 RepID=A0A9W2Z0W1_BIOGL|nr:uncharacterized protein LOC106053486 [Biomphalaria glabrata]
MIFFWSLLLLFNRALGALPNVPDCHAAQDAPFDTTNPISLFGVTHEISNKATPQRTGNLRQRGPLPTGHFATNHIKNKDIWPIIQTPYQVLLTNQGSVLDANPMNRWSDPKRTDFMEQQSAWEQGKPWNKLNDMGSNLRQMTSGPDGTPLAGFSGKSGVRVSIHGAGEPELTAFGELYANFIYHGNGGSMEVPVVRGAALMTHVLKGANPVVKPYCLSSINRHNTNFDCPVMPSAGDGGSGNIDGECHGGTLTITLHNSKVVSDLSLIQWAAEPKSNWGRTFMRSCDAAHCTAEDGGKTVKIRIPNSSGTMSFAVNYIGHYLVPQDWTNHPAETTCSGRRQARAPGDISLTATCTASHDLTIDVNLGPEAFPGLDHFQYALETATTWHTGFTPGMHVCTPSTCQHTGSHVIIKTKAPSNDYKLAVNIVGITTLPRGAWLEQPYQGKCDGSTVTDGSGSPQGTQQPPAHTQSPVNVNYAYTAGDINAFNTKFVMELSEPGNELPNQSRKFILYFSSPVRARIDQGAQEITFEPQAGGQYNGLLQVAYAGASPRGDGSQVNFFDKYAGVYSHNPEVKYCVSRSRNKGYVSFDWHPVDASGSPARSGTLLMATMPHQALILSRTHQLVDTPFTFKGYEGNDWLMEYDVLHTEVDPDPAGVAKVRANPAQLQAVLAAIERDAQNENLDAICAHTDSYNGGKGIGMVTRLASLSRAFNTNHYTKLENSIRSCLEKWLRITDTLDDMWKFHYDDVWGGLFLRATGDAGVDWGVDYGFPYYNDHHFHLGYFLYAMAYYVKHNRAWGDAHRAAIYALARDVGNPSSRDANFPVSRQKDLYTGFSWASGLVPGIRQEESASEGINCYHGLAALGDAFNDDNMRQTGQILLALEVASVREYWQVRSHNRNHFPPILQNFGVVGMITESDFYAYTLNWPCDPNIFPQRHGCLVGIQVIPITAVSKYWMDHEWAQSIQHTCESAISPSSNPSYHLAEKTPDFMRPLGVGWQAFCYAAMAPLDDAHATAAANYVKDRRPQDLVGGTGAASTLLFIYAST